MAPTAVPPPAPALSQANPPPPQQQGGYGGEGGGGGGLPEALQGDPAVRDAHFKYQRDMALLKMQIEKVRGEAEAGGGGNTGD